ncbi:hypothetical protein BO86DRAFT_434798, partial [Aspergillus japonicus CBS 114.51]
MYGRIHSLEITIRRLGIITHIQAELQIDRVHHSDAILEIENDPLLGHEGGAQHERQGVRRPGNAKGPDDDACPAPVRVGPAQMLGDKQVEDRVLGHLVLDVLLVPAMHHEGRLAGTDLGPGDIARVVGSHDAKRGAGVQGHRAESLRRPQPHPRLHVAPAGQLPRAARPQGVLEAEVRRDHQFRRREGTHRLRFVVGGGKGDPEGRVVLLPVFRGVVGWVVLVAGTGVGVAGMSLLGFRVVLLGRMVRGLVILLVLARMVLGPDHLAIGNVNIRTIEGEH